MTSSIDLAYNTNMDKLIIPEYGRNIQKMIEHAKKIEDKEERNKSVKVIIKVMDLINPSPKSNTSSEEHNQKLWAHLQIISNFELEIDSPYELPSKENYQSRPEKVPYPSNAIKYGHYGKIMEDMVKEATNFKEGEDKKNLLSILPTCLKPLICNGIEIQLMTILLLNSWRSYLKENLQLQLINSEIRQIL
jgi:hypothetical protein